MGTMKMLHRLASWQSPFLYVRLTFWFLTIIISLLPFVLAESKFFNGFDTTLLGFYHKHYQGILAVFIVTITTSMFDVLSLLILLVTFKSYIAVPAVVIMGILALFLLI